MKQPVVQTRGALGFTLIEVLFAVMVFSIVLAAIHTVFYSAIRLRNKAVETLDQALPVNLALSIIRRDLAGIVVPGGTFFGEFVTTGQSDTNMLSPGFYTTSGHLSEQEPWAEVQKINYYLANSTNQTPGQDLYRSVTRNLLPTLQESTEGQRLLGGVDDFVLWYYNGTQWVESWDSTQDELPLPCAIKVQLYLAAATNAPPAAQRQPIELIVPLAVWTGTNSASTNQTDGSMSSGGGGS